MYFPVNSKSGEYPVVEAEGEFVLVPCNYYTLYTGTIPVDFEDEATISTIKAAVPRMKKTMNKHIGVAIASVQVGLRQSFFVLDTDLFKVEDDVYCNPEILAVSKPPVKVKEGCLSHEDSIFYRERFPHVTLRYQTLDGETKVLDTRKAPNTMYRRVLAQAFQHELDHLQGIDVRDGKRKKFYDSGIS